MFSIMFRKLTALFLFALLPTFAFAATAVTRYVVTDCTSFNGDGTSTSCAASNGAAGAYSTLALAITDVVNDYPNFVSSDVQVTVDCRGATADTSVPDITGITTDATRYLVISVAQANRHNGKWDTSHYRLVNSGYDAALRVRNGFVRIDGIQLEQAKTGAGGGTPAHGIRLETATNNCDLRVENSVLRYTGDYTNQEARAIYDGGYRTGTSCFVMARNNIAYDWTRGLYLVTNASDIVVAYNNTVVDATTVGFEYRLYGSGATFYMKNNSVQGSNTNYNSDGSSGATFTHVTNLSEDTSSPDSSFRSKVVTFADETGNDFHLGSGDTVAKDLGTDLSADTYAFSTDIDGATRSGSWDIGADELTSSGQNLLLIGTGGE